MKNFRLTISRDGSSVALMTREAGEKDAHEAVSVYPSVQLYPLAVDRYHKDLPNVFVDVLDTIDGNGPAPTETGKEKAAFSYPDITLRTLARRAAREVADGSGKVNERFDDARGLWQKLQQHAIADVVRPSDEPILDVRRNRNWRKNQPLASVRADPQAWYVTLAYSRSNKGKDAMHAYRGLTAVLDALIADSDADVAGESQKIRKAVLDDLDYPTYRQVAAILGDSNMLVFHNDGDLASWIRHETGNKDGCAEPGTPLVLHLRSSRGAQIVPGDTHAASTADFDGLSSGKQLQISQFANRLAPRARRATSSSGSRGQSRSRRR